MENSRRMIYPCTLTAKIMQFPMKYYFNNSPYFRGWVFAIIILAPVMYKIQQASFSPAIVEKREKRLRGDYEEYLEHQKHLL